jgi:hypothetical protein
VREAVVFSVDGQFERVFQPKSRRWIMDFMEEAEKLAGAVVAVEAAKKLDPGASIVTEAAAAFAGYEGTGAIAEHLEKKDESNG